MLEFEASWRFDSPGEIPEGAVRDLFGFATTAAASTNRVRALEIFKKYFAQVAGTPYSPSSSTSWAENDLQGLMFDAAKNAPLFIQAFHAACIGVRDIGAIVPDTSALNRVLGQHGTGFRLHPPRIVRSNAGEATPLPIPAPSVSEQARTVIQRSLNESERLLNAGRHRQAVQEVLWLLETVTTAFKDTATPSGSVEGKYFVKIVRDLRRLHRGDVLDQVLGWVTRLYGYLSSPTGGGVRHGRDIADPSDLEAHEARLFCDLIRAYVGFLLSAHERYGGRLS